jgi:hypothetical protein
VVERTLGGFANEGLQCYRNVGFQMLLHLPIFCNWLDVYLQCHLPDDTPCNMGSSTVTGPRECKLCELHEICTSDWNNEEIPLVFTQLTKKILQTWKKATTTATAEEDPAEYLEEVFNQLYNATDPMLYVTPL